VLALGGEPACEPSVQAVPLRHFDPRPSGQEDRRLRLEGPRVWIELPETVAVRVIRGTLNALDTVPNPVRPVVSDSEGAFAPTRRPATAAHAMMTGFVAATRVIDGAERWAGRRVDWGQGGRLAVIPYASVTYTPLAYYNQASRQVRLGFITADGDVQGYTGHPWCWESPVQDLLVDTATNPDVGAHEPATAVVLPAKPAATAPVRCRSAESARRRCRRSRQAARRRST